MPYHKRVQHLFKITDKNGFTMNFTQWGEGVTHYPGVRVETGVPGIRAYLCTNRVIHAYVHPLQAILFDPYHRGYLATGGILWYAEGVVATGDGHKVGCYWLKTIKKIPNNELNKIKSILPERENLVALRCLYEIIKMARNAFGNQKGSHLRFALQADLERLEKITLRAVKRNDPTYWNGRTLRKVLNRMNADQVKRKLDATIYSHIMEICALMNVKIQGRLKPSRISSLMRLREYISRYDLSVGCVRYHNFNIKKKSFHYLIGDPDV